MRCFLDRDGILNYDYGYVGTLQRFKWIDQVFPVLSLLAARGYSLAIVTNQSGLARNYYTLSDFYDISFYMLDYLHKVHGLSVEINFCPHHPGSSCQCRKPLPGMLLRYKITEMDIMIGDQSSDMEAAATAGIKNRWLVSPIPLGPFTHHSTTLQELYMAMTMGLL